MFRTWNYIRRKDSCGWLCTEEYRTFFDFGASAVFHVDQAIATYVWSSAQASRPRCSVRVRLPLFAAWPPPQFACWAATEHAAVPRSSQAPTCPTTLAVRFTPPNWWTAGLCWHAGSIASIPPQMTHYSLPACCSLRRYADKVGEAEITSCVASSPRIGAYSDCAKAYDGQTRPSRGWQVDDSDKQRAIKLFFTKASPGVHSRVVCQPACAGRPSTACCQSGAL